MNSITIDLLSARIVTCFLVGNHNLSGSTLFLEHSTDNFVANAVTVATWEQLTNYTIFKQVSAISRRYWRLTRSGALADYPFIGEMYLGSHLQITRPLYDYNPTQEITEVDVTRAYDGTIKTSERLKFRVLEFSLGMSTALRTSLKAFLADVGTTKNFWVCPKPDSVPEGHWGAFFCANELPESAIGINIPTVNAEGHFLFKEVI